MDSKPLYLLRVSGDNKERGQMHFKWAVIKAFFQF